MNIYKITLRITVPKTKPAYRTGCVLASKKSKAEEIALQRAKTHITSKDCDLSFAIHKVETVPPAFIWAEEKTE